MMRLAGAAGGGSTHEPTVYTVLARAARSHSRRYLGVEALLAGGATALILAVRPGLWPVASLTAAVALYASWGLLAHGAGRAPAWPLRLVQTIVAGLATAVTLAGLGGLAIRAFWGTASSPYGTCHRPDGTSFACHADGSRRAVNPAG